MTVDENVGGDYRVGSACVRAAVVTISIAVATVFVSGVVVATSTVATLMLLATSVGLIVKKRVI